MATRRWVTVAILLTLSAMPALAQLDLGVSYIPGSVLKTEEARSFEAFYQIEESLVGDNIVGLHAGYSLAWLFYGSIDSYIMPPWWIQAQTSVVDGRGVYAPGYLNLIGAGLRPSIGPLQILVTAGINTMYIHSTSVPAEFQEANGTFAVGANLRIGLLWNLKPISIGVVGTSVFGSFEQMQVTLMELFQQGDRAAIETFARTLIPSFHVNINFGGGGDD